MACVFLLARANLLGATLKKQSRGPVNLGRPDRACLALGGVRTASLLAGSGNLRETRAPIGCSMARRRRARRLPSIVIVACAWRSARMHEEA